MSKLLDFSYLFIDRRFQGENLKFFWGGTLFSPLSLITDQNWPHMSAYDPPILMQNPFPHKKWGCLQKTRALYLKKWLSYGHIKFRKRKSQNFQKKLARLKNCTNSVNFWDIVEIFFSYGHWCFPLKVPSIILHKICLIGPSEAVK